MSANTPQSVANVIRRLPPEFRNPDLRYFAASGFLIKHYINEEIIKKRDHPFMRHKSGKPQWEYPARMTQLASFLFDLRSDPGFEEICRRLRSLDLVSAHYELTGALLLKAHDFVIDAKPETGVRGEDFDFTAIKGECVVNGEVTALRPAKFTHKNVLNALGHKRKQLPSTAPSIIICFYPFEAWADQVDDIHEELSCIADEFLRSSRRVNYLLFSREDFISKPNGGALICSSRKHRNLNPRHASAVLDEAMSKPPVNHETINALLAEDRAFTVGLTGYYRWIDELLGN